MFNLAAIIAELGSVNKITKEMTDEPPPIRHLSNTACAARYVPQPCCDQKHISSCQSFAHPAKGIMRRMIDKTTGSRAEGTQRSSARSLRYVRIAALLVVALGLNLLVLAIPGSWIEGLRGYGLLGYAAAFGITALANASVVVPVPYPTMIAQLARVLDDSVGVAIVGAAGSTLGETTAFAVGRAGRAVIEDTRFGHWLKQQLRSPLRALIVFFLPSSLPDPFLDVAGLTAGSLGVSFSVFFTATFAGRIIKLLIFAELGRGLL